MLMALLQFKGPPLITTIRTIRTTPTTRTIATTRTVGCYGHRRPTTVRCTALLMAAVTPLLPMMFLGRSATPLAHLHRRRFKKPSHRRQQPHSTHSRRCLTGLCQDTLRVQRHTRTSMAAAAAAAAAAEEPAARIPTLRSHGKGLVTQCASSPPHSTPFSKCFTRGLRRT